jgi:hypothetical protein
MAKRVTVTEQLLKDARRVTGGKTYADAVQKALEEIVRRSKPRKVLVQEKASNAVEMAKRVTVNEQLLEDARTATGEKTNIATVRKALEEIVRIARLRIALHEFQKEAAKGDFFWPNYLEEIRPNARSVHFRKSPSGRTRKRRALGDRLG